MISEPGTYKGETLASKTRVELVGDHRLTTFRIPGTPLRGGVIPNRLGPMGEFDIDPDLFRQLIYEHEFGSADASKRPDKPYGMKEEPYLHIFPRPEPLGLDPRGGVIPRGYGKFRREVLFSADTEAEAIERAIGLANEYGLPVLEYSALLGEMGRAKVLWHPEGWKPTYLFGIEVV